jgi:hypothetical protein
MSKRDDFLAAARSQCSKGIYVWGGDGEDLLAMTDPEAWIRKKEFSTKDAKRAINLFNKRKAEGINPIRAFDCSGLVYWCNKQAKIGYGDKSADGYWKECDPVSALEAGDLVFHHNGVKCTHVGIYNGDGWVIESFGRDDGVVKTHWSSRKIGYWNRQGRLRKLEDDYGLLGDVNLDGKVTAADAACILRYIAGLEELNEQQLKNADVNLDGKVNNDDAQLILKYIAGDSTLPPHKTIHLTGNLWLRAEGNKESKKLAIAKKGNDYPLLGRDPNTGWYMTAVGKHIGYISNTTKYTILM